MTKKILKNVLLFSMVTLLSFDMPAGWIKSGSQQKSYEMGIDIGKGKNGKNAATIKSIDAKIDGFGSLVQESKPGKYLGKRVKMTCHVKTENVTAWAGLWFRVEQCGSEQAPAFDNMRDRPIKGTTDWTKYEIVLDVSQNAIQLTYGVMLNGTGQIWFDNMTFEVVDNTVKLTGIQPPVVKTERPPMVDEPINLDFEK